jgi:hypothetical protein
MDRWAGRGNLDGWCVCGSPADTIIRSRGPAMSIDHRVHPRLLALTLAFALGLLATGCDSATDAIEDAVSPGPDVEEEPEAALRDAVTALADWGGIEVAFRLEADADARAAMIGRGELTDEQEELLLGAFVVARASGLDDPDDGAFETSVMVGGSPVLDLRIVGEQRVFVRVDTERLAALSEDTDLGDVDDLIVTARMFGLGDVAQAAADGRWVEIIGIDDVMDLAGVEEAEEPDLDEQELDALSTRLAAILERFVDEDVAVSYVGSDDVGERVRMITDGASVEALFEQLTTEFDRAGLVDDLGDGRLDELDVDDDLVVSIDAWIDGGELRQIAFDVVSLDAEEDPPGELLIVVAMEEFTGTIAQPDDAEPFDVLSLVGAFFGGMGNELSGGDGVGEEPFEQSDDPPSGEEDLTPGCVSEEELDLIEEFEGSAALGELEQLFDAGVLERC